MWVEMRGVEPRLTEEGQKNQTEHVERGQERGAKSDDRDDVAPGWEDRARPGADDQLVLAPEPGERHDTGVGQRGGQESPERDWHVLAQATHLLDVLLLMHAVDHATAAEEKQPLEKRVRHQVEDRRHP